MTACRLCALPGQLDSILHEDLLSRVRPYLLISATLSVCGDFNHFMRQTGIDLLGRKRILMASKASPFNYQSHALLSLPQDLPFPDMRKQGYIEAVLVQLEELIELSHGPTLALFTTYRMMEIVYRELSARITAFPLFSMGKGQLGAIRDFRKSGNGVLLASDSAGEGIDLAGNILSSLVMVKLPFPTPGSVLEYEKSLYVDFPRLSVRGYCAKYADEAAPVDREGHPQGDGYLCVLYTGLPCRGGGIGMIFWQLCRICRLRTE